MIDKKICKVCVFLKIYPDNFVLEVNSLLVSGVTEKKLKELLFKSKVSTNTIPPTFHFFKNHRDNCLIDFTPISVSQSNKEVVLVNSTIPVEFKEMSLFDKIGQVQIMLTDILYNQVVNLSKNNSKTNSKSDIDAIKSLFDLILTKYLDFSDLSFSNDKKELEDVGLDMIRRTINVSLVSDKDILDIAKLFLHNKISNTVSDNEEIVSLSKIELLIETINNPSLKKELDNYLSNPNIFKFFDKKY